MNLKTLSMMGALLLLAGTGANAQKKKEVLNDSNTPLHLLQPAYKVPYGIAHYRGDKGRYGSCPSLFGKEYSDSCR